MYIRRAKTKDIPQLNRLLFQVNKVHSDGRPDLFKAGAKKYSDDELKKILQLIKEDHNIALGIYKIFKGIQMCKNESFLLFD